MDQMFADPRWRNNVASYMPTVPGANGMQMSLNQVQQQTQLYLADKRRIMLDHVRYMDQCIAIAQQPGIHQNFPIAPADPINNLMQMTGYYDQMWQKDLDVQADHAELLLRLALRAYQQEHGAYPTRLTDLVPHYLAQLPADPTRSSISLVYQRAGNSYSLHRIANPAVTSPGSPATNPQGGR